VTRTVDSQVASDARGPEQGPGADEELVMFLERDQLVDDRARPVARATLSARTRAALWALRVFAVLVSAMVIYTFVSQLAS
jgi:hypothetical protein